LDYTERFLCPPDANADTCRKVYGDMTVFVTPSTPESSTMQAVQAILKMGMNEGVFADDSISTDLVKVNYLGYNDGRSRPVQGVLDSNSTAEAKSSINPLLLSGLVGLAILALIAAMLVGRQKKRAGTESEMNNVAAGDKSLATGNDLDDADGTFTGVPEYGDFGDANNQLHDVHRCQSSTCELCMRANLGPSFLKAGPLSGIPPSPAYDASAEGRRRDLLV
jgi:hypothetical protein